MAARQWTPEQRAQQSEKIRQWQPWARSTGARTAGSKAKASLNAYKGGHRAMLRGMAALLHAQREGLKQV